MQDKHFVILHGKENRDILISAIYIILRIFWIAFLKVSLFLMSAIIELKLLEKAKEFSNKHKVVLVIKGANTITVFENKFYINATGNPGLSTAGSGDVLTGIITGLISQGYNPLYAAVFGVYLHGKAADIAVEDYGYQSLIASHVIEYLGAAYMDLFKQPETPSEEHKDEA